MYQRCSRQDKVIMFRQLHWVLLLCKLFAEEEHYVPLCGQSVVPILYPSEEAGASCGHDSIVAQLFTCT